MFTWLYRIILSILGIVMVSLAVTFLVIWNQTRRELSQFEAEYEETQWELSALREEREEKEAYLKAFLNDREFVERVVRERLGYVAPGETLFRFED